jgi:hypothetical protein
MLLLQSYFITVRKLTHFKFYGHLITLTINVCWALSLHSKLFLTPLFITEYNLLNPQCLSINQNDNIKTVQPCHISTHWKSLHICKTYNSIHSKLFSYYSLHALWMITVSSTNKCTCYTNIYLYISRYLAPTCSSWSPFSGSSEPKSLKLTAVN